MNTICELSSLLGINEADDISRLRFFLLLERIHLGNVCRARLHFCLPFDFVYLFPDSLSHFKMSFLSYYIFYQDPFVEVQVPIVKRTSGLSLPDLTSENLKSVQMPSKIEL